MTEKRPLWSEAGREAPPVLGKWWRLYLVVAANLVVMIALLWAFTRAFS